MSSIGLPELIIVLMISMSAVVIMWPAGRICRRAGYSPWLGVLSVIPIANVLLLWFIALAEWPSARAARQP